MGTFLAVSRHAIVDLSAPWDPERLMQEYLADPKEQEALEISADDLSILVHEGGMVRFNLEHRWMGTMQAEMRLSLLNPSQVQLDMQGSVSPSWWLRVVALPFRARLRRLIDKGIDDLINDLKTQSEKIKPSDQEAASRPARSAPSPQLRGVRWTVEVSSLQGRRLYQHSEGSL